MMALVSRRDLARLLRENRRFLSEAQLKQHVRDLNRGDKKSIATEYEVLLLNAFAKHGEVIHEPDMPGSTKPDLLFTPAAPATRVLADFVTISDEDARRNNPAEEFRRALAGLFHRHGHATAGISFRIEAELRGPRGKQKMTLRLPKKGQIEREVKRRFGRFVEAVDAGPAQPREIYIDETDFGVRVNYVPGAGIVSGSHLLFTTVYSKTNNPLTNALERKADQLSKSGFKGVTGVLVCDGDCAGLQSIFSLDVGFRTHFRGQELVRDFFRRHRSVSFVTALMVKQPFSNPPVLTFETATFLNAHARYPCPQELAALLEGLPASLPVPRSTPGNALNYFGFAGPHVGLSKYGGAMMKGEEIRLPARALVELLAGKIDLNRFREDHHLVSSRPGEASIDFARRLSEGRTLESARIERAPDDDDDWIVFTFGDPDPAISPFTGE